MSKDEVSFSHLIDAQGDIVRHSDKALRPLGWYLADMLFEVETESMMEEGAKNGEELD